MTERLLVIMPDEVAAELRAEIPKGMISEFVTDQIRAGLAARKLRSLDDAIAHIAANDKPLLDRLGNVQ